MANENMFLFHALIMGIFITFVYDNLRIFRRVIPHRQFFVSLEDFIFWIYCAAEVFLMMYHESDGTLRWFAVLGALLGMFAYKKLVSPFFVKYVSLWLSKLLGFLGKIADFLFRPFKIFLKWIRKKLSNFRKRIKGRRQSESPDAKKKLTFFMKMLRMKI